MLFIGLRRKTKPIYETIPDRNPNRTSIDRIKRQVFGIKQKQEPFQAH
jgi:hypothetical protein